jgi:SAM-dependent methyltransferase
MTAHVETQRTTRFSESPSEVGVPRLDVSLSCAINTTVRCCSMNPSITSSIEEALHVPIRGWDFSWLHGRARETPPPWNYPELVRAALSQSRISLDIDTGGGEFIERSSPMPGFLVATEGYAPNVPVAASRLAPLGIAVVHAESAPDNVEQADADPWDRGSPLPFKDDVFDVVIDRHSSYWPSEVMRVLKHGGTFLTQQRSEAGSDGEAWHRLFGRSSHPHGRFTLEFAVRQVIRAGLEVRRAEEADTPIVFTDLAGVVFYLRLVPWAVEGFDVNMDGQALEAIQRRLESDGELRVRGSHMLIECTKS